MRNFSRKFTVLLFVFAIGFLFVYKTGASSTKDCERNHKYSLPLTVEALIPRHADIVWYSDANYSSEGDEILAVFYRTPVIGGNDSLQYLEFFRLRAHGSFATPRDRIYLGGRGLYAVDKVVENNKVITVHAREHQGNDCIANPTRRVDIIVQYGPGAITVSKKYPQQKPESVGDK